MKKKQKNENRICKMQKIEENKDVGIEDRRV